MQNSGNEPKEYLKTKDITFLNAVNYARLAQFSSHQALKGATNSAFCQNAPKPSGSQAKAETGTNSRLDRLRVLVGSELTSQGKDFSRRCHSDPERSEGEESRSQNEGTARFLVVRQLTDSLE